MDWKKKVVVANPVNKPKVNPKLLPDPVQQPEVQQSEVQQKEQPEPVEHLDSLVDFPLDESVYGSGWSLAELMDEFGNRESSGGDRLGSLDER